MKLRTWSGSVIDTSEHPFILHRWALGWIRHGLSRVVRRARPRRELFFVLKYGGKIYLRMTETQLRAEVASAGGVGVQYRDKSLVFQCYEFDPNQKEEK